MTEFVERRRYFRVEDKIELAYRILQDDETADNMAYAEQYRSKVYAELDNQIGLSCQKVSKQLPEVAELIDLLNRKISLLSKAENNSVIGYGERPQEQPVNLSACGIAFLGDEPVALGTRLLLRMRLKPGNNEVAVISYVISCELMSEGGKASSYLWRADFAEVDDERQEFLIRHVMQCQVRNLRGRRRERP